VARNHIAAVESALVAVRKGRPVIVRDSQDRENEADLILAAEKVTPASINFLIKNGGGLICVSMTQDRATKLELPAMVRAEENGQTFGCNFTVSVDARKGVTTGISAADRSTTIRTLSDPKTQPHDLVRPGHIFPVRARTGGILVRAGHTEASMDLAHLAGLQPVGVMCEVLDRQGKPAGQATIERLAKRHSLQVIHISELAEYRRYTEKLVERVATSQLPTRFGEFTLHVYDCPSMNREHIAMVKGQIQSDRAVLVRVHSQCVTGDTLSSVRCDCREQLDSALRHIEERGQGVLVYLSQEGRGIGLANKIRAYALQDQGYDTVQANERLGLPRDMRDYSIGAQILADLGVQKIYLLTNNPQKISGIERYGLSIVKRIPLESEPRRSNRAYLKVKKDKLGHLLSKIQ
jgi:3,4-dihydroxy 2-butanone 4-phosphate synthase/GTP cyclohydrolase II